MPARPQQHKRHQITFGGNGYNLATAGPVFPGGGPRPSWEEERVRFAAARVTSDAQGYQNWSPEEEAVWQITHFAGGFGHKLWSNGTYYYGSDTTTGEGVDTRIPGETKLAPLIYSGATTNTESRLYDHFERSIGGTETAFGCFGRKIMYWTNPASPNNESRDSGTGLYHVSATNFQGTAAGLFTFIAVKSSVNMPQPYLTFDGGSNTGTYAQDGQDATVAPVVTSFSDDGTHTTDTVAPFAHTLNSLVAADDAFYIVGDQVFEGVKVDLTNMNGNASTLTAKYWTGSAWAALSGVSDGTSTSSKSFGQDGNITWTLPQNWDITTVDGNVGWAVQFTWSANFDSSVSVTDVDLIQRDTAEHFRVFEDEIWRIVKTSGGFDLTHSANGGTSASWATVGTVTPLSNPVTGMFVAGGRLFITAEEGLFALSGDGTSINEEVWPHPSEVSDSNNGVGSTNWSGDLWLTTRGGQYRVMENQGYLLFDRRKGTQALLSNDSPVRGRMTCMSGDDYYLYGVIRAEDGTSHLMAYDDAAERWHSLNNLGEITSRHMWLSDVGHSTNPLLYFNAGTDLRYIVLPRSSPNPAHDAACTYATGGTLYLGQFHAEFTREVKAWLESQMVSEGLSSTETVQYAYRTTDDGDWTTLGTFDEDPGGRLTFAVSPTSRMIEVKLTMARGGTTTNTPVMRAVQTRYAVRFPYKRRFLFAVSLSDFAATGSGLDSRSSAQLETQIVNTVESGAAVALVKPSGVSFDVLPLTGKGFLVQDDERKPVEWAYFVEAVELQATQRGRYIGLASYTYNALSAYTYSQLESGDVS